MTLLGLAMNDPRTQVMGAGVLALIAMIAAIVLSRRLKRWPAGNEEMVRLSGAIRRGAMAFLRTEYTILFFFVIVLGGALTVFVDAGGWENFQWCLDNGKLSTLLLGTADISIPDAEGPVRGGTAFCFLVGALCSVMAGFIGMRTATSLPTA